MEKQILYRLGAETQRFFKSRFLPSLLFHFFYSSLRLCVSAAIFSAFAQAQTLAPGAPGRDAQWATAGKQGVGTSASLESKVWFTLAQGVMTEVYYPDVTVANVHLLQFVVVNPKTKKVETEQDDANHKIESLVTGRSKNTTPFLPAAVYKHFYSLSSLAFKQTNSSKTGGWSIEKTYIADPKNNSVLISVNFHTGNPDLELYVYYDPSLANSGMHDTGWFEGRTFLSSDGQIASALTCGRCKISDATNGFLGVNDGLTQLRENGKIVQPFSRAEKGNLVQVAKIAPVSLGRGSNMLFALGFGNMPQAALTTAYNTLQKGYEKVYQEYQEGWLDYLSKIPKVEPKYQAQFNMAAMILKAHEDKTARGANIASLTVPWGGGANANEANVGGYHLVWSRDLYQVATAYLALGDKPAAERALDFLFKVQQKPDGSFPQNSYLDGRPFWGSLQHDEVAFPLIMAYQLGRFDKATYENHVKRAADFIVRTGPRTPQERWEEESGYSPSTIAAEIAGLVCAAEIARKNGDEASATIYLATADDWARKVEMWTATTTGKYGDGNYYLRITQNGKPDAGEKIELNNGAGFFDEREIVDAGFLELVRLGIKSPDDPLIAKSLKVIDEIIKVNTPNGEGFYRYNHDGYGEMDDGRRWNWDGKYTGKGRLWALLSGERGQYELANSAFYKNEAMGISPTTKGEYVYSYKEQAKKRLDAMLGFANEGLMIPEQVWDKKETPKTADRQFVPELRFGEGTGSATPLAWSMAQFIRLAVNLQEDRNTDTPDIVYNRYVKNGIPGQASGFGEKDQNVILPVKAGEKFSLTRQAAPKTKVAISYKGETRLVPVSEKGEFKIEITAPEKEEIGILAIEMPDGATAFERVKVRSIDRIEPQKFSAELVEKIKNAAQSPIIENGRAILFYRGAAKSVMVAGDMTSWNPGRIFMQPVGENLWAVQLDFVPTARVEYQLIVDGKWIADPSNPNKLDNGVGGVNSFFAMPAYKPTEWDKPVNFEPVLETVEIQSKVFGETRKVQVYAPLTLTTEPYDQPVLYFQDGGDYVKRAKAIEVYTNLFKAKKVKPFIMVFIDYKDRTKEYFASDDYARFLATEVVPAIDAKYNTLKSREGRAVIGASLGGITSVWVGLKYPEAFSRIGGQSSSFWVDNERVVRELAKLDPAKTKFKFYFDDGTMEGVEDTRRVNVLLRGKGYPVVYIEGETGHNWTAWRDRLVEAFVALMN